MNGELSVCSVVQTSKQRRNTHDDPNKQKIVWNNTEIITKTRSTVTWLLPVMRFAKQRKDTEHIKYDHFTWHRNKSNKVIINNLDSLFLCHFLHRHFVSCCTFSLSLFSLFSSYDDLCKQSLIVNVQNIRSLSDDPLKFVNHPLHFVLFNVVRPYSTKNNALYELTLLGG